MKKLTTFLLLALTLSACSPQLRLNRLLDRHPELKVATHNHIIHDTITLPHLTTQTPIALSDLQYLALAAPLPLTEEIANIDMPSIPIEAGCAALTIQPHPSSRDSLLFTLQQLPEIIALCDTVEVPNIIVTEVPAQLTTWQQFCHWSGIITWLIILFYIVHRAAEEYCKRR